MPCLQCVSFPCQLLNFGGTSKFARLRPLTPYLLLLLPSVPSPQFSSYLPLLPIFPLFCVRIRRTHLREEIIFNSRPLTLQVLSEGAERHPKAVDFVLPPHLCKTCALVCAYERTSVIHLHTRKTLFSKLRDSFPPELLQ